SFGTVSAGILRDGWYAPLSLLVTSCVFLVAYGTFGRTRLLRVLPAAALTGIVAGIFWLCREEGIWLLPTVLVILVGLAGSTFVARPRTTAGREGRRRRVLL